MQGLRPHHFIQVFANVYSHLLFLFLELLNDLQINTVSLHQGCSKDIAAYIDNFWEYETNPFGTIQQSKQSSKSHICLSLAKHFAHKNQL